MFKNNYFSTLKIDQGHKTNEKFVFKKTIAPWVKNDSTVTSYPPSSPQPLWSNSSNKVGQSMKTRGVYAEQS